MLKTYVCVWSDKSAAEMVKFYKSVFKGTQVGKYAYWGQKSHGHQRRFHSYRAHHHLGSETDAFEWVHEDAIQ